MEPWIRASRQGDRDAFNQLVLLWRKRIYNLCLRMLGQPEEAADATQEIFLKAYRKIGRLREIDRFAPWIYRIAGNECRSRMRWRAVRRHTSSATHEELEGIFTADANPEQEAVMGDRQRRVRGALATLPNGERWIVELKFYQDRTFAEISEILEMHPSTVKSRFYRGLGRLREELKPHIART